LDDSKRNINGRGTGVAVSKETTIMTVFPSKFTLPDGTVVNWTTADEIDTPANYVPGYELFGTVVNNYYFIAIQATVSTDPSIGAGTSIWLNTDQNTATGYLAGSIGAEYYVANVGGSYYLYTSTGNYVSALTSSLSPDGESLEIAIPRSLLTPTGTTAPTNINIAAQVDYGTSSVVNFPTYFGTYPEYTITDPATLLPKTDVHKVAIVYSDTTANLYFSKTAYDDLFMAAQNQARMAGVSYDVIDESQLTNISNLIGYDAIIFPSMADVNTAQLPAIMSTLQSAVYNYHIGIITSGNFLTNDQTGAALPGNPYANMETLLGIAPTSYGNGASITVTAADVSNPIMKSYTSGQLIQSYSNESYIAYQGVGSVTPDVLVNQNVTPAGSTTATTLPGVVETTTGGTNVHFATADLLGDSNLLSNAIQNVVLGTQPGVALHLSRDAGVVAARMDMDQSQFPADVSPASGPGIYDVLMPILQQWKSTYDFVGSYFINIGDNPTDINGTGPSYTDPTKSLPYYQQILAMGEEIGNHSYTHLINPPATTFRATTVGNTPAGSTTITLDQVPSFYGITVGMWLSGTGIGSTTLSSGAEMHTQVTAVSGNTITISYMPGGYADPTNDGTVSSIPSGTTLTFSIPPENTNFLEPVTGTVLSGDGHPFTYQYEFADSKTSEQQMLGVPIYGAAIPGSNETYATDQNILAYYPSGTGYTGYLTGGWTGIGSGYPSAFGYLDPTDQGSVYLAPNMTFDFTEIQYEGKTLAQAEADWVAQFNAINANAAGTPIVVWPIHDYGAAAWNTTNDSPTGSPYSTSMYTDFIQQAYAANYEFVTMEDLASRIVAQQKASINYTTSGNTITATVTPDPTAPNLGTMALDVINGGTEVIQNVTNWYAYNAQELFLPNNGGAYTINLGTAQDVVTHIESLPMRGDLLSVKGDGLDLSFSMVGDGQVVVDLGQHGTLAPTVTGATSYNLAANGQLDITLTGLGQHDVAVWFLAQVLSVAFSADTGLSSTDFVTKTATQTITGTLSSPLAAGDVVQVSLDNGTTWLTATAAAGAMTFSLANVTLIGSNTLIARVASSTGVTSTPLTQAYVLDTVAETPTNLALAAGSDSGLSATDNVTNVTKPTFTGNGEAAGLITVYDGTTVLGTGFVAANGTWSVTDTVALADGVHSITAVEEDLAGNIGAPSTALSVTIDTVAETPTNLALAPGSDSGSSSTDKITNITKPTFTGNGEAGGLITVYDGTTVLGTGTVAANGTWSVTDTNVTLTNGVHNITATEKDLAGNLGGASTPLSITIDTVPPPPPVFTNLTESYYGLYTTLYGSGTAGTTVSVLNGTTVLGSTTVGTGGSWSWTFLTGSSSSVRILTAVATDVAGNKSGTSGTAQIGTSGRDTFTSTAGNDVFYGGAGADTFVFNSIFGHDVIADFQASGWSHDKIDFHGSSVLNSFTAVMNHATNVSGGVLITQDAGDTLMLNGASKWSLTQSDFTYA
jgi:serralysin